MVNKRRFQRIRDLSKSVDGTEKSNMKKPKCKVPKSFYALCSHPQVSNHLTILSESLPSDLNDESCYLRQSKQAKSISAASKKWQNSSESTVWFIVATDNKQMAVSYFDYSAGSEVMFNNLGHFSYAAIQV
ncbi:uncharacterized protein LOC111312098 isoform X3 [Durio zibethinus]|uniref:Uncharacterized protein LOC111312098 isoform X3 n=1 Tax=Durio zibethinus TaxID=66656 RepID=A0A6P6ASK2_DURZI|nr:uncharacterized protein LOC111312098 isoform X3 [Durio zibethinus]